MDIAFRNFVWDDEKERLNFTKHGVTFVEAAEAFRDWRRKIFRDSAHSGEEPRFFCIGRAGGRVLTVRFVLRSGKIRIFGAGYWRKGAREYETRD
jgi:uncharacterized DUF497 family protein